MRMNMAAILETEEFNSLHEELQHKTNIIEFYHKYFC